MAAFVEETDDAVQFLVCRDGSDRARRPHGPGHAGHTAELGWLVIIPGEQENGFAAEAGPLCLEHAFDDRGLHKVWVRVNANNTSSIQLLETLGFERGGVLREQEYAGGERADVYR